MKTFQKQIKLPPYRRGFHLITDLVLKSIPEIKEIKIGFTHIFIKHTSASLTINENADPTVGHDLENYLNKIVPENEPYFKHNYEGADDMPAHIKNSILGSSIQIPITNGTFNLGIWQGVFLNEHRNHGGSRSLVITVFGI